MLIRDAVKGELQKIKELRLQSYEEHAEKIPEAHWDALKQSILSDEGEQAGIERMVAELDGELVGTVALFSPEIEAYKGLVEGQLNHPELRMLAVSPKARGKGVAKALVQECMKRSKNNGYKSMGLHTADFMESAVNLYTSLGFKRVPENDFIPLDDGIIVKAFNIEF
ncbi:GNAT family N-acetyltransferase [Ureibacillus chungkukjangi]|uniref:Putative N-acetyltransferase YhbS n=1 Tax=Ureibacillus chungkukjangi TaxID=1202712 RepID=A0A318TLZ0_9BACL|nr:GNAT family N-acetyltransferase [Ureibacillus chungkukjangi]MCM3388545.1 GNAT family N-acetyltransferase [Ureibacillus chungkukjangi]PYF05861.1 putative N-acetyltransferase YhbS [Ureibacillus chungkukjangi]